MAAKKEPITCFPMEPQVKRELHRNQHVTYKVMKRPLQIWCELFVAMTGETLPLQSRYRHPSPFRIAGKATKGIVYTCALCECVGSPERGAASWPEAGSFRQTHRCWETRTKPYTWAYSSCLCDRHSDCRQNYGLALVCNSAQKRNGS